MKGATRRTGRSWRRLLRSNSGTTALEFGLVSLPFLVMVLGAFEIAFDLYTKAVLDIGLLQAARQIQTGNAQNALNGSDFISEYFCTGTGALLDCTNVYFKVESLSLTSSQDFYDFTTGQAPVSNGALDLTGYGSGNFCNSGPSQTLLISAVYAGPTFVGALLPNSFAVSYNGGLVHPTFSSVGTVTEAFTIPSATAGAAPAC